MGYFVPGSDSDTEIKLEDENDGEVLIQVGGVYIARLKGNGVLYLINGISEDNDEGLQVDESGCIVVEQDEEEEE